MDLNPRSRKGPFVLLQIVGLHESAFIGKQRPLSFSLMITKRNVACRRTSAVQNESFSLYFFRCIKILLKQRMIMEILRYCLPSLAIAIKHSQAIAEYRLDFDVSGRPFFLLIISLNLKIYSF